MLLTCRHPKIYNYSEGGDIVNTFCPFINGECREDCVFHLNHKVAGENGVTVCQLVTSSDVSKCLCDILIKEKQDKK